MRFAGLFLGLGLINEIVWRNFSHDVWVTFKSFGLMGLTMLFLITQMGFIQSVTIPKEESAEEPGAEA